MNVKDSLIGVPVRWVTCGFLARVTAECGLWHCVYLNNNCTCMKSLVHNSVITCEIESLKTKIYIGSALTKRTAAKMISTLNFRFQ